MNEELKQRMIRMAADVFIPVGERQALVNSLYQMVDDAALAKQMALQVQDDLASIKQGIAILLSLANINQPIIEETNENSEIAATESSIAAENTDIIVAHAKPED